MKKLLWITCLVLAFTAFAACGGKKDKTSSTPSSNSEDIEAGGAYNPEWGIELPEDDFN